MGIDDILKYFIASIMSILLIFLLAQMIKIQVAPIGYKVGYNFFIASFYPDKLQYCLYKYYKTRNFDTYYNGYPASMLLFYFPSAAEFSGLINESSELTTNLYKCFNVIYGEFYVRIGEIEHDRRLYAYYSPIKYSAGPLFMGVWLHNVTSELNNQTYVLNIYDAAINAKLNIYSISDFITAGYTLLGPGIIYALVHSTKSFVRGFIDRLKRFIGWIKHDVIGNCDEYSNRNKEYSRKAVSLALSRGVIVTDLGSNPYILEVYMLGDYKQEPKCMRVIERGEDLYMLGENIVRELPCQCDYYISRWKYCKENCWNSDSEEEEKCEYCNKIQSPEDMETSDPCGCGVGSGSSGGGGGGRSRDVRT